MGTSLLRSARAHVMVDADVLRHDGDLALDDTTEHHLRRVLRLRDGEMVGVTDGDGGWRTAIVRLDGNSLALEPATATVIEERRPEVVLAVAMPKGDRLDWLVQKVAELGVDRLTLLHTERSVVRWKADKVERQLGRLQRIADEACRQSRRVWRLRVDGPVDAATVLGAYIVAEPGGRRLTATDRQLAIGPEGGWSPDELATAADTVSLGPNILRTETAAVAAATLCGDFDF